MKTDDYYNYLIDEGIAEEQTLEVATSINGYSNQTLDDVLYCLTGYKDIKQYLEYEDTYTFMQYYDDEEEGE